MEIKNKKLVPEATIPAYAKPGDAGMDMKAISYEYNNEMDCHIYGTGIAMEIPKGYVGLVFLRSSNRKTNCYLPNAVGVIDSGYRGEIMVSLKHRNLHGNPPYKIGDKLVQIIIIPYPQIEFVEVDELSKTERGDGGHGSTGE